MDRKPEFLAAVDLAAKAQSLTEAQNQQLKSSLLLKPRRQPSAFHVAAEAVAKNITDLRAFVKSHQLDYVSSGTYSHGDKDKIEAEVGMFVKACTQQVEQLKQSVLAAQKPRPAQPALASHVAAHLHGVVLILAEQLHAVTAAFDRCRGERHRQAGEREKWERKPARATGKPQAATGGLPPDSGRGGPAPAAQQQQQQQATSLAFEQENRGLIDHLNSTATQVLGLERTLRDIVTLNNMLSTAVLHQAQAIEAIYDNACEATVFVVRGNVHLTQAVAVNRSTRRYVLVLLVVASLSLLFYDWVNS